MTAAYRNILVPTDGSPLSNRALKAAMRLAASQKGKVTALHVIPAYAPPAYVDGIVPLPEIYTAADYGRSTRVYANRLLAKVEKQALAAKVRFDKVIVNDDRPWKAIIRAARSRHCDLIVMASHGRHGVDELLLGSETHKVLTHSKTPVLVCH